MVKYNGNDLPLKSKINQHKVTKRRTLDFLLGHRTLINKPIPVISPVILNINNTMESSISGNIEVNSQHHNYSVLDNINTKTHFELPY